MKTILLLLLTFSSSRLFAQRDKLDAITEKIVAEGKTLYRSEMASWYGTDIFMEKHPDKENGGGYFSYIKDGVPTCIFVSRAETPVVIAEISFDSTYNVNTAVMNTKERNMTGIEKDYFELRKNALDVINSDTLFQVYKNSSLNIIPIITGKEKKVYVITGTTRSGVVLLGNDYLINFDKNNKAVSSKKIHQNLIPIDITKGDDVSSMHSHLPETGDYITPTDICTLMLYQRFTKWKTHTVLSENYVSFWDGEKNNLAVITREAYQKIYEHQETKD